MPEERIIELYSEAEVAVVPSLYEGFSLPAIEAMSCGVPLVATTGGALPEVVGADDETALLVPPGDSEALAARIATALDDAELRARIGAAGRQRVIDRWTWRHTALGTVEHYRALLAETREHPAPPTRRLTAPLPASPRTDCGQSADRADRRLRQAGPPARRAAARPGVRLRPPRLRGPAPRRPGGGLRHGHSPS